MKVDISNKNITSLTEINWNVYSDEITELNCSYNQLTNLVGCPNTIQELNCSQNNLTNLVGCPNSVKELDCNSNRLTSLEGCPNTVKELWCWDNPLALEWLNLSIDEIKDKLFNIRVEEFIKNRSARIIQNAWEQYYYIPNEITNETLYIKRLIERGELPISTN